jgi:hypothetical protein
VHLLGALRDSPSTWASPQLKIRPIFTFTTQFRSELSQIKSHRVKTLQESHYIKSESGEDVGAPMLVLSGSRNAATRNDFLHWGSTISLLNIQPRGTLPRLHRRIGDFHSCSSAFGSLRVSSRGMAQHLSN